MRPVRLEISALGPYVGPLTLDFRVLGDNRLFLLNGPTGSGKTMLLDAVCFALFGETTGKQRNARSLRSQHAPANLMTEVTFDFALGSRQYRVWRRPEQERPYRRGTGTTKEPPAAKLWDRTGVIQDSVDGHALAARSEDVDQSVIEILGFTADQFRNITVLPQGEFQRFLNAPSGEREKILEVLFQTTIYREILDALLAREQEAERAVRAARDTRDALLKQAQAASEEELQTKIVEIETQLSAAAEEIVELRQRRGAADVALNAAREADRRLRELRESGDAFDALAKRESDFRAKEAELDAARRAAPIEPVATERAQRSVEFTSAERNLTNAKAALDLAEKVAAQSRQALTGEEARDPERNEALRREQWFKDLSARMAQLETARTDLQAAASAHQTAEQQLVGARDGLSKCQAAIAQWEKDHAALMLSASSLERFRAESAELNRVAEKRNLLVGASRRNSDAERAAQLAKDKLAGAELVFEQKRSAVEQLEARWVEAQAAILAEALVPGAPCPVCGSTEHPDPAVSWETLPSETDRKRAREALGNAESARELARKNAAAAAIELAGAAAEVQSMTRDLGDWSRIEDRDFTARRAAIFQALSDAEEAARRAVDIKQKLDETRSWIPGWEMSRDKAEAACREAAAKLEGARAVERERAAGIPAEYRDPVALNRALTAAAQKVVELQDKLRKARGAALEADRQLSACRTAVEHGEKTALGTREAAVAAAGRLARVLQEGGFANEAEFRTALRAQTQISALDASIRRFQNELKGAEQRLLRAREAAEGIATPDVASAEAALKRCQEEHDAGLLKQDRLKRDAQQSARWLDEVRKLVAAEDEAERKRRVISTLAQTANGRNTRRITLQRFVQVTLLERVLAAATQRLQLMSSGRYWLQVAQTAADGRSTAGLDLEVFDAHTGQARRVSTLSGGESFLASLALALGLSDTAQSHAGGCHLESVFIDEGFGTLDPEALELAMATLRDLQQGGRLVGIISHVPELRHQIDVRLDVIRLKRGSTARFVVAGAGSLGEPVAAAN